MFVASTSTKIFGMQWLVKSRGSPITSRIDYAVAVKKGKFRAFNFRA